MAEIRLNINGKKVTGYESQTIPSSQGQQH